MQVIELDNKNSTTRQVFKADPQVVAGLLKASKKSDEKFETVLYLPKREDRQGEGGLRIKAYFKVGGIIPSTLISNGSALEDQLPLNTNTSNEVKPLITVVTVVFNGEKFLEETILSVINQTYDNVEYIIIDGGSTDGTLDIIKKYEHAIDYWVSEKDKGIYDAMNKGIELASGQWINFMNGGDRFYGNDVLQIISFETDLVDYDVVYGNHQIIYPSGRIRMAKAGLIKDLWKGSQFCHQATFVKNRYHKVNKFNLCTKIVADFEFFYYAWNRGAIFKYLNLNIVKYAAGGLSDIRRIECILGFWMIVKKNNIINLYFVKKILLEILKSMIKKTYENI
jgi:glycosyltransferase involved in cell wall biosynthesis